MGLLGSIITKAVTTAATNSTIKVVEHATENVIGSVIVATSKAKSEKDDVSMKNDIVLIKPSRSSDDYIYEDAMECARELLGSGFESVTLKPLNQLGRFSKRDYGKINSISINGKTSFSSKKSFPTSSYIVIEYHSFKNNVDPSVYTNIKLIEPGTIYRNQPTDNRTQLQTPVIEQTKNFCSFCGTQIKNKSAKFCSQCGKLLS